MAVAAIAAKRIIRRKTSTLVTRGGEVFYKKVRYIRSSEERATILCTPKDAIRVRYIDVQMQEGFSDCGVFSIAYNYATALAYGKQPGRCFFRARNDEDSSDELFSLYWAADAAL